METTTETSVGETPTHAGTIIETTKVETQQCGNHHHSDERPHERPHAVPSYDTSINMKPYVETTTRSGDDPSRDPMLGTVPRVVLSGQEPFRRNPSGEMCPSLLHHLHGIQVATCLPEGCVCRRCIACPGNMVATIARAASDPPGGTPREGRTHLYAASHAERSKARHKPPA